MALVTCFRESTNALRQGFLVNRRFAFGKAFLVDSCRCKERRFSVYYALPFTVQSDYLTVSF